MGLIRLSQKVWSIRIMFEHAECEVAVAPGL